MKLTWILALALTSGCASAPMASAAPAIEVTAALSGALDRHLVLTHEVDAANHCSVSGAPAMHFVTGGGVVEAPPGPPTYRLAIDRGGVQIALSALPYRLSQATYDDASNANLWVTTADGVWTLPHQPEPGVSIHLTFAADGQSGTIEARGLVAMRNNAPDRNAKRLDVSGGWRCAVGQRWVGGFDSRRQSANTRIA